MTRPPRVGASHDATELAGDRVTMSELSLEYQLHPNFRDLWVEGSRDVHLWTWFLEQIGIQSVRIATLESVQVPTLGTVIGGVAMRQHNQRDRLIVFAHTLDNLGCSGQATCVVDRDRPDLSRPETTCLIYTDYRDVEMYALNSSTINKHLRLTCGIPTSGKGILQWLVPLARQVVAVHDEMDARGWGVEPVDLAKYCSYSKEDGRLEFREDAYVTACLGRCGKLLARAEFCLSAARRTADRLDDRHHVRGHTLLELLGRYMRGRLGIDHSRAQGLASSLLSSVEHADLCAYPLFRKVRSRVA